MLIYEIYKMIDGEKLRLRVKRYSNGTIHVNKIDTKTNLPVDSINPKLLGLWYY